ncbi:cupin [Candidatus Binatia bacterium]|nr:cupin [Candidatus Binatia bacterium]
MAEGKTEPRSGESAIPKRDLASFADAFRAAHAGDALGPVAGTILLEDERVRVWSMTLAPGEASPLHRHELDYLIVLVAGDRIAAVPGPDSTRAPRESAVTPGRTVFLRAGETEWAVNTGATEYREILIELKTPSAG